MSKRRVSARIASNEASGDTASADLDEPDPSLLTVAQLRKALSNKGLDQSGKKPQLVARLLEAAGEGNSTSNKKVKKEPESSDMKKASDILKQQEATKQAKTKGAISNHKVDQYVPMSVNYKVTKDWDCMLNQTNIGDNNNKYYVIQMLEKSNKYFVWNRWGRVGECGINALHGPFTTEDGASVEFKKKFKDKTKNDWGNRENFAPQPGKYTLLEMADEDEKTEDKVILPKGVGEKPKKVKTSILDEDTQDLIKLIFDNDMFKNAMKSFDIDVKKMPLGKLSKIQLAKGFEILEDIDVNLKSGKIVKNAPLSDLSSKFYTAIPHDFGRQRPPTINTLEMLQQKKDMLMVLGDIEVALSMQKDKDKKFEDMDEVPHPHDVNYGLLNCDLELLNSGTEEFKVNRHYEDTRFKEHASIKNRKLLWHGTNVAVVAAILQSGLRIMPHSGGRVGKGIYFASENSKSAGYVGPAHHNGKAIGIMFLNEVALGKENTITANNSSLKQAPSGYDSVVARGQTEPDPGKDTHMTIDGNKVVVPQAKPIHTEYTSSNFYQSEYLVYKESQNRIRYLITLKF